MRLRNALLTAALGAAVVTSSAAAAGVQPNSWSNTQSRYGHTLKQTGQWEVVDTGGATVDVPFRCLVDGGAGDAVAVGILQCYLLGADGKRYHAADVGASTGSHWARAGLAQGVKRQRYRICMQSHALFRSGTNYFATTLACSP